MGVIISFVMSDIELKPGVDFIGISTPFICHDGQGKILMHQRSEQTRDEQGNWDTGGGKLDFGEDPKVGVLREIFEEYGCKGEVEGQLPAFSLIRKNNKGETTHWVAVPFIVRVDPKEVINNEPHKINEIKWAALDDLPQPLHTGVKIILDRYRDKLIEFLMS